MAISREMIYIPCWFVWPDIVFVPVFPQRIQCGGLVPITACRDDEFLIRETVQNVYRTCKGFADKSSLLPEQLFVMQMDEFMKRRYEFRFNLLTSQVECRQRNSFVLFSSGK